MNKKYLECITGIRLNTHRINVAKNKIKQQK